MNKFQLKDASPVIILSGIEQVTINESENQPKEKEKEKEKDKNNDYNLPKTKIETKFYAGIARAASRMDAVIINSGCYVGIESFT
jgi:hypothetical protein